MGEKSAARLRGCRHSSRKADRLRMKSPFHITAYAARQTCDFCLPFNRLQRIDVSQARLVSCVEGKLLDLEVLGRQ